MSESAASERDTHTPRHKGAHSRLRILFIGALASPLPSPLFIYCFAFAFSFRLYRCPFEGACRVGGIAAALSHDNERRRGKG